MTDNDLYNKVRSEILSEIEKTIPKSELREYWKGYHQGIKDSILNSPTPPSITEDDRKPFELGYNHARYNWPLLKQRTQLPEPKRPPAAYKRKIRCARTEEIPPNPNREPMTSIEITIPTRINDLVQYHADLLSVPRDLLYSIAGEEIAKRQSARALPLDPRVLQLAFDEAIFGYRASPTGDNHAGRTSPTDNSPIPKETTTFTSESDTNNHANPTNQ